MNLGLLSRWRDRDDWPDDDPQANDAPPAPAQKDTPAAGGAPARSSEKQLVGDGRYALLLTRSVPAGGARQLDAARAALEADMALVPAGQITLGAPLGEGAAATSLDFEIVQSVECETVEVPALYLDRRAVSNADFARFVAGGGYDDMELWPEEIWPSVLQFVDSTGAPGPRFWSGGRPPRGKDNHPVVGVCWYEANAYARWSGKRLTTATEWEKAASWPADLSGRGPKVRYPWGNSFAANRANTWLSGRRETVPVEDFPEGCAPNGIYQLVGNVWEWVEDRYEGPLVPEGIHVHLEQPMRQIRGGAFDTYFEIEATCHFCTGQPELDRRDNVGFRCALSADRLQLSV